MSWFLLVVFGMMMVAVPSMVFYGRHVLPLRMWFAALWLWLGALMVVITAAEDLTAEANPWHLACAISSAAGAPGIA